MPGRCYRQHRFVHQIGVAVPAADISDAVDGDLAEEHCVEALDVRFSTHRPGRSPVMQVVLDLVSERVQDRSYVASHLGLQMLVYDTIHLGSIHAKLP